MSPPRRDADVPRRPAALALQRRPVGGPLAGGAAVWLVSAPVTANHLSSEPDSTKMIGATQLGGKATVVLISESPLRVAGNPPVVILTVETRPFPSSVRQLTSARNDVSSLIPCNSGGTSGSLVKTRPRTEIMR